uniref:NADH dehydrogenase subunit 6 n=1 Tax=Acaciothrips ebneri TaxID=2970656 RepID=UPI002182091F|nr:NADH dehydrogenase subunit 6 [Acaciothrips ebneri]UVG40786.1 NADH dehydrogenase subunit 6 [Acaciothrips ebneri]
MNMIFFFLFLFSLIMVFFFVLKHPLFMSLMLILNTMFLCIFVSMFSFSSWNSYILFLMFLGGILILFLYNISIISMEMFNPLNIKSVIYLLMFFLSFMMFFNFKETFFNDSLTFFLKKEFSNMTFFFLEYNLSSILFLICYIFFSLICIINLIYLMKDKGSMNYS